MAPKADAWQTMRQAAQDDPEACHALGQLLFALEAALGHPAAFPTLEVANAYAHALQFATQEAMVRSQWWVSSRARGDALDPFRPIHLADVAQQLCDDAWGLARLPDQIAHAHLAIQLDPDCADAYILLAEQEARTPAEKRRFYEQAVQAGLRTIGGVQFDEWRGHFWGVIQTRPYMRARAGLASCLWQQGARREAIKHVQELLRLNPNDNLGLRYDLASWLLDVADDMGFAALCGQWSRTLAAVGGAQRDAAADGSEGARWLYPRALFAFRQHGRSPEAEQALSRALASNPHVPAYLLGFLAHPAQRPEQYGEGSVEEAIAYTIDGWQGWKNTSGALQWLGEHLPKARGPGRRFTRGKAR